MRELARVGNKVQLGGKRDLGQVYKVVRPSVLNLLEEPVLKGGQRLHIDKVNPQKLRILRTRFSCESAQSIELARDREEFAVRGQDMQPSVGRNLRRHQLHRELMRVVSPLHYVTTSLWILGASQVQHRQDAVAGFWHIDLECLVPVGCISSLLQLVAPLCSIPTALGGDLPKRVVEKLDDCPRSR